MNLNIGDKIRELYSDEVGEVIGYYGEDYWVDFQRGAKAVKKEEINYSPYKGYTKVEANE